MRVMDIALYTSLVGFVIVMSVTPGPNNLMMMSSSVLFGVRATIPHWLGVNIGFNIMLVAAVFGLGELVQRYDWMLPLVKIGGSVWLSWMAWKFVQAGLAPVKSGSSLKPEQRSRPFKLHEAALFQWVNPKAILMTISAAGAYIALADGPTERALLIVVTFLLFGAPCGMLWILAGGALKRFMSGEKTARWLNLGIGGLLVATTGLILFG
jgi:threonine/homoserine/homoserine lactone efflux protein